MPLDLRDVDFMPNSEAKPGTLPVSQTMDSLADTLEDPLTKHGMGRMDRAREKGSSVMESMGHALRGIGKKKLTGAAARKEAEKRKKESKVGSRRREKVVDLLADVQSMGGAAVRVSYLRKNFRDALYAHMKSEFTHENLEFLEALDAGMPREEIIDTFVREGSPKQINLSFADQQAIISGGADPKLGEKEAVTLIGGNVFDRLKASSVFIEEAGKRL